MINYNKIPKTPGNIPKIIIRTSWQNTQDINIEILNTLENTRTLNPDYILCYFNNDDIEEFLKDYSLHIYNCYKKIIPGAYKSDLFRYCILEKYGGCYSDIGQVIYKSFDHICEDYNIVIVKDRNHIYGIYNSLMCSVKNHIFFKKLIDKTCKNIENMFYGKDSLDITGPTMASNVFNCTFYKECDQVRNNYLDFPNINIKNTKIRILKHESDKNILNDNSFIKDENDEIIINTKFKDYYKIMYSKKPRYGYLWLMYRVYNNNSIFPKIIHLFESNKKHIEYMNKLKKSLNSDWEIKLWDFNKIKLFLINTYPELLNHNLFYTLSQEQIIYFCSLLIIYFYGGIYINEDITINYNNIIKLIPKNGKNICIIYKNEYITDNILSAYPKNDLIEDSINYFISMSKFSNIISYTYNKKKYNNIMNVKL